MGMRMVEYLSIAQQCRGNKPQHQPHLINLAQRLTARPLAYKLQHYRLRTSMQLDIVFLAICML
jgi:hypothetical protein